MRAPRERSEAAALRLQGFFRSARRLAGAARILRQEPVDGRHRREHEARLADAEAMVARMEKREARMQVLALRKALTPLAPETL